MATTIKEPSRSSGLGGLFDWAKEIVSRAILDGRLIEGIVLAKSVATDIEHKMGRTPRGVILVKSDIATYLAMSSFTKTHVTLTSAGAAKVSVWIF